MPARGTELGSARSRDSSPSTLQQHNSRRRSIAIQDILNPISTERRNSPGRRYSVDSSDSESGSIRSRQSPPTSTTHPGTGSPRTRERRQFRPTYSDEEVLFIWYYRIDLGYDWQEICRAYNAQFPSRPRVGIGGIQCKYYRYCEESGIPKVRNRDRSASAVQKYGMRSRTGLTYPWMRN